MIQAIYLDTNVFISAYESSTERSDAMWTVLDAIDSGEFRGVTSELTVAELLPRPLSLGQTDLSDTYLEVLSGEARIDVAPVSRRVLIETAALRSRHAALKLPDAVHLVTAIQQGCSIFLSDDRRLPLPPGIEGVRLTLDSLNEIRRLST